jgi:hypothetical protein
MGSPHRFGSGDHRIEIDELGVVFCRLFRPDFLHRLDGIAHPLKAGRIDGAMVCHFVLVPATADAEEEPSLVHRSIEATSFAVWIASRR